MKPRSTLVLALALAVLCAAYWGARQYTVHRAEQMASNQVVFDIDPADVSAITIDRIDEDPVSALRQDDGQWSIEKPNPDIVPLEALWERLTDKLAGLTSIRTITLDATADQLGEYGLDVPALRVAATADGDEIGLAFGSKDPTQQYRYAVDSQGKVFLATEDAFFEFNRKLEDLRHRFLVDNRDAPIVRLEFARIWTGTETVQMENPPEVGQESPPMVVERETPEDPWRVTAPVNAIADQERVQALVSELQYGMGYSFVDTPEDLSDYGLDPAAARISLVDNASGKAQTVFFGHMNEGEPGGVYARRPDRPAVFTVEPHILTLFPRSLQDFRDRHLLTRPISDLASLHYAGSDHQFTLNNDPETGWRVVEDDQDANQARISSYLGNLKSVSSEVFVNDDDLAFYGLDNPLLQIELHYPDATTPRVLRVARDPNEDRVFYATQDSGDIVRLTEQEARKLFYDPAEFRSRQAMRFAPAAAEQVMLTFEGTDYRFEKHHGLWTVTAPEGHKLQNQRDMVLLLDVLSNTKFLSGAPETDEPDGGFGLDPATLRVRVQTRRPGEDSLAETHGPFLIGGVAADGALARYATVAGREGVYRVDQEVVTGVREALRGVVAPEGN